MMRSFGCVCVAALLATAPAFGAGSVVMSIEMNGSNEVAYQDLTVPFEVQIVLKNVIGMDKMSSFGVTLTGDPGFVLAPATYDEDFGWVMNYNNGTKWDRANGIQFVGGPLPMVGPPEAEVGTIALQDAAKLGRGEPGIAAWVEFTAMPPLGDYFIDGVGAYVGDKNYQPMDVTVIPLHITPEPVSALLLLAGVPMLRRRR